LKRATYPSGYPKPSPQINADSAGRGLRRPPFAGKHSPYDRDHLSGVRQLVEHGSSPVLDCSREHRITAGGEHQYLHLRVHAPELGYEIDAEAVGQANVEDRHVGALEHSRVPRQ
jgi:hypothetical protein